MPKHLAIGVNSIGGTVHFENVKTAQVLYLDPQGNPVLFSVAPRLQFTPLNTTTAPPVKMVNVKTGDLFSGFIVGFQTPQTLDLEWQATERA